MTSRITLASCVLLGSLTLNAAFGQTIEAGSRVQFERAGQTFEGRVVSVRGGGQLYEIESTVDGKTRSIVVAAKFVKALPNSDTGAWRTWSDQSGQFEVEAKLQSQTAFEVTLLKRDGKLVKVALDKLSIADQEFVATYEATVGSENPFAGGVASGTGSMANSSGASGAPANSGSGLQLTEPVVFATASGLQTQASGPPTGFEPDPARFDFSQIDTAAMNIPKPEGTTGRPLFISQSGARLCYQVRSGRAFGRDPVKPFTQIYLIDGENRRTKMVGEIPGDSIWLCSGDPETGNVLGAVMKSGDEKSRSLCVISGIAEGRPNVVAHWRMYPDKEDAADFVRYRKILSNGMVVVYFDGKIHAYDFEQGVEAWTQPSSAFNEPAITAGGRYAACMVDRAIVILETKTGKQIGAIPSGENGAVAMGFSPDGTRLAVASGNKVIVHDVRTTEVVYQHEANTALGALGKQVFWLEDQLLLLPTGVLLDMEKDLVVWKYNLLDDGIDYTDVEHHGLLAFTRGARMTVVRLPHSQAQSASKSTPPNLIALRSGDAVNVQVNAAGFGGMSDVNQHLEQALTTAGYKPGASAQTQIVASVTRGASKTEEYRIIGAGFGTEEVSYTPITSRVEVRQNGKVIWQRSTTTGLPFFLNGGETLQEAAKKAEQPNLGFFSGLVLPKQILKPEYQQGFGSSNVNADGIRDL